MTKLRIIFIFVSVAISTLTYAQKEDFARELYLGFGGGVLMPKVDFMPSVLQKTNFGIHGGISAKYITEKHLGLLLELNYTQRGWTEEFEDNPDFAYSRTLNYIEIPFMTHVYFGNKVRFVFNAGPQVGFLLGNSSTMSEGLRDYVDEMKESTEYRVGTQYGNSLKKFDYGLVGGAGLEFKTPAGNMQLEGRYYFGLGDIFENRKSQENYYFSRSAHRIIDIKLSYYFKLK